MMRPAGTHFIWATGAAAVLAVATCVIAAHLSGTRAPVWIVFVLGGAIVGLIFGRAVLHRYADP
jgi:hypothetical protein